MSKTKVFIWSVILILLLWAVILRWSLIDPVGSWLRILLGSITLLFLPWRRITWVAFDAKEIDDLERIALSFAFSISVVPLLVFYVNLLGIRISEWLVLAIVTIIVCVCAGRSMRKAHKSSI